MEQYTLNMQSLRWYHWHLSEYYACTAVKVRVLGTSVLPWMCTKGATTKVLQDWQYGRRDRVECIHN